MLTVTASPLTERLRAALNLRTRQVIEAQREIVALQDRVVNLQTENQLLSYRLARLEEEHQ
jgi:hypothetical protein